MFTRYLLTKQIIKGFFFQKIHAYIYIYSYPTQIHTGEEELIRPELGRQINCKILKSKESIFYQEAENCKKGVWDKIDQMLNKETKAKLSCHRWRKKKAKMRRRERLQKDQVLISRPSTDLS